MDNFVVEPDTRTDLQRLCALVSLTLPAASIPDADWPALCRAASDQGLSALLLTQVSDETIPEISREVLKQDLRQNAARLALIEAVRPAINSALDAAGIAAIWFKGAALAYTIYDSPHLRPMADLDILVEPDQRAFAREQLEKLGFHSPQRADLSLQADDPIIQQTRPHDYLVGGVGGHVVLELHDRLLAVDDDLLPLAKLDWFWQRQQKASWSGGSFMTFSPAAHLLYLCAHAELQHGEAFFYGLRFFDLHRLITEQSIDWDDFTSGAAYLGWELAGARALWVSQSLFSTPLPDGMIESLGGADVGRLNLIVSDWDRLRSQVKRVRSLSLWERLRWWGRAILPPAAFMREKSGARSLAGLLISYPRRWWRILRRLIGSR